MRNALEIKYNSCDCHPETCSCGKYVVYCADKRICSLFNDEEKVNFLKMLLAVKSDNVNVFHT